VKTLSSATRTLQPGDMIAACAHVILQSGAIAPDCCFHFPRGKQMFARDESGKLTRIAALAACKACQCLPGNPKYTELVEIAVPPTLSPPVHN
jgi:hypothetical protein